jgi:hypothetical protein
MYGAFRRLTRLTAINVWPGGSLRFTKSALRAMGLPGWHTRPPYVPLTDTDVDEIREGLRGLNIQETEDLASVTDAVG